MKHKCPIESNSEQVPEPNLKAYCLHTKLLLYISSKRSYCRVSPTNALCNKGWHFWKGGFVTDKTGLKIFVFINAMIFAFTTFVTNPPLYGKIASKVWKIYFQYISPHFLDAAGGQISDLWLLLLSNSSLFSALMSHLPLLLLHSAFSS